MATVGYETYGQEAVHMRSWAQTTKSGVQSAEVGSETIAIASAYEQIGDTLQTATNIVRQLGIPIETRLDTELGIVIGERTPLIPTKKRVSMTPPPPSPSFSRPPMYGIGIKVSNSVPHTILEIVDVRDENGKDVSRLLERGDILEGINQMPADITIDDLEWNIFGPADSLVQLSFFRQRNGHKYTVTLLRHIPLQFAIGLSIDRKTPYTVKQVYEALDPQNENIGSLFSIGDIVEKVDGRPATSLRLMKDIILGPIDSVCIFNMRNPHTGNTYQASVKRTIPISAWTRWEEQGGMYTDSKVKMFGSVEPSMPMNYSTDREFRSTEVYGFDGEDVKGEFI